MKIRRRAERRDEGGTETVRGVEIRALPLCCKWRREEGGIERGQGRGIGLVNFDRANEETAVFLI